MECQKGLSAVLSIAAIGVAVVAGVGSCRRGDPAARPPGPGEADEEGARRGGGRDGGPPFREDGTVPTGRGTEGDADAAGVEDVADGGRAERDTGPLADAARPDASRGSGGPCGPSRPCPGGQTCEGGRCVEPPVCASEMDCIGSRRCVGGTCRDPCLQHRDCPAGLTCSDGACLPPPRRECATDEDCPGRRTCDITFGACVEPAECTSDGDCDTSRDGVRRCSEVLGRCVACIVDSDCPGEQTCDREGGGFRCVEPQNCTRNVDCSPGRVCRQADGRCVWSMPCADDRFEENDSFDQARPLAEQRYTGLALCSGDPDYFRVVVPPGRSLRVTIRFQALADGLGVALFPATEPGRSVGVGRSIPTGSEVHLPGSLPEGGVFVVQVRALKGGSNFYTLEVELPPCVDDPAEDDDSPDLARSIRATEAATGWMCGPDSDWFRLAVDRDRVLQADLIFDGRRGGLELYAWSEDGLDGFPVRAVGVTGGMVLRGPFPAGTAFLEVRGAAGVAQPYRLEFSLPPAVAPCHDDYLEENDGPLTAVGIAPGVFRGLALCAEDPDWYGIDLDEGDGLRVTAVSAGGPVPRLLLLEPATEVPMATEPLAEASEGVLVFGHARTGGRHLLRVTGEPGVGYSLRVEKVGGGFCANDGFEPNDAPGFETVVRPGRLSARLCAGDVDLYAVATGTMSRLEAVLHRDNVAGNVELFLLDPSGNVVGRDGGASPVQRVRGRAGEAGTFVVGVASAFGAEVDYVDYSLDVAVTPGNDTCETPETLTPGGVAAGTTERSENDSVGSCGGGGSDVVFRFGLDEPSGVEVVLVPAGPEGPTGLYLRRSCFDPESEEACVAGLDPTGEVHLRAELLPAGNHFLFVDGPAGAGGGNFDLGLTVVPGGICFPDWHEPDPDARAAAVGLGEHGDLTLCEADVDSFPVTVRSGMGLAARAIPLRGSRPITLELRDLGRGGEGVVVAGPVPGGITATVPPEGEGNRRFAARVEGGPARYRLRLVPVERNGPEAAPDACPTARRLAPGVAESGDTRLLNDLHAGSCGNPLAGASTAAEAIYAFTLPEESSVRLVASGPFDKVLYLRRACDDPASEVACVDRTLLPDEVLEVHALEAGEYFVFVDGFGSSEGPYEVLLEVGEPRFPPPNDRCDAAEVLLPGTVVEGTTRLARDDYRSPCTRLAFHSAADVVFTFRLDRMARVLLTLDDDDPAFDSVMYLRDFCDFREVLACADDPEPQVVEMLLEAGTYFLVVDGWGAGEGRFRLGYQVLEEFE